MHDKNKQKNNIPNERKMNVNEENRGGAPEKQFIL